MAEVSDKIRLRIVTPEKTVVDKDVAAVQFKGEDGMYGILPRHAALMTALVPGVVKIDTGAGGAHSREEIVVSDGFAEIQDNVLTLVCEAGDLAEEITLEEALAKEKEARARIEAASKIDPDLPRAEALLARALLMQEVARKRSGTGSLR